MRLSSLALLALLAVQTLDAGQPEHTFRIGGGKFLLDGKPFQIISGEMHFARVPREYWHQRLRMARAMGLNTIATYVFWNLHEPQEGQYNFSGNADVAGFVKAAQEEGLWVLLRPSPYACAEWEFGGYPWWLQNRKDLTVRSRDPDFLEMSRKYFTELGKQLAPLQITQGGPIIMVQLENEYGSYGKDKEYLSINRQIIRDAGFDVELYTCDGPSQMPDGYLPGLLPAVNGLDDVAEVRKLIDRHNDGHGPYFIAEWYPGWFDSWGLGHHTEPADQYAAVLDTVLSHGFSINMYMVHGGTTRGFMNGANCDRRQAYLPQTCSYDYDAPIDESGNTTPKYIAFRNVILKHLAPNSILPDIPEKTKVITLPRIYLDQAVSILRDPGPSVKSPAPLAFEDLQQGYGYVLYRTVLQGPRHAVLKISRLRDYGIVYLDGHRVAILDRRLGNDSVNLVLSVGADTLDILAENLGRVNYGPYLNDNRKGIIGEVLLDGEVVTGWEIYRFPFDDFMAYRFTSGKISGGPVIRKGTFRLDETGDTYLDMSKWGKGCVWLNGHNLGRYWSIGPTQTMYVPGPWLNKGENEVVVFEELKPDQHELTSLGEPILDRLTVPVVSVIRTIDTTRHVNIVRLASSDTTARIFYTFDGSMPDSGSPLYSAALTFDSSASVSVRVLLGDTYSDAVEKVSIHRSLSTGKQLHQVSAYSPRYPAGGPGALVDGFLGGMNFRDGCWQGYDSSDCSVVIDLGSVQPVSAIKATFYQDIDSWIFLPEYAIVSFSGDGKNYAHEIRTGNPVPLQQAGVIRQPFSFSPNDTKARFIRFVAKNIGVCPPWHRGAGGKAWLFVDEIEVEP